MKAIRLGVVGSGGMAQRRAAAFAAMEGCKLTALAARNANAPGPNWPSDTRWSC